MTRVGVPSSALWARRLLARLAVTGIVSVGILGGCGRDALRDSGRDASGGSGGGIAGGTGGSGGATGGTSGSGGGPSGDGGAARVEAGTDVRPGTVTLTLQPSAAPPLPVGQSLQWRAFVPLGGTQRDITSEAELVWSSTESAVATVTARGGRVTGVAPGRAEIRAQHPLFGMARVSLQVTPAAVTGLVVDPAQVQLQPDETRPLSARAIYSDGSESDVTFAAQWTTFDQRVASVGNGAERPGLVKGVAGGSTTVSAVFAGASASAQVTVSPPMLELSLSISPPMLTRPRGGTGAFRAIARLPSGAITDVTSQASWSSENTATATALGAGQFRCNTNTSTNVIARFMNVTATASLICATAPAEVVDLQISELNNSDLFVGLRYGLQAFAVYSDGRQPTLVMNNITWGSSDQAIATVDGTGVLVGAAPGTVTITARHMGVTGQRSFTFVAR